MTSLYGYSPKTNEFSLLKTSLSLNESDIEIIQIKSILLEAQNRIKNTNCCSCKMFVSGILIFMIFGLSSTLIILRNENTANLLILFGSWILLSILLFFVFWLVYDRKIGKRAGKMKMFFLENKDKFRNELGSLNLKLKIHTQLVFCPSTMKKNDNLYAIIKKSCLPKKVKGSKVMMVYDSSNPTQEENQTNQSFVTKPVLQVSKPKFYPFSIIFKRRITDCETGLGMEFCVRKRIDSSKPSIGKSTINTGTISSGVQFYEREGIVLHSYWKNITKTDIDEMRKQKISRWNMSGNGSKNYLKKKYTVFDLGSEIKNINKQDKIEIEIAELEPKIDL